jgi:polyhydroxyalkanoate synthesis regulator protein
MSKPRIIKKYPNRRLYDTDISSYITLEDVRQLIVDGEEIEVRDAKTGEDLSRLLSQVIRMYGDSLQGFMGSYLERSMQLFTDQQHQFRSQLNNLLGKTPWSMLNSLTERNMDLWRSFQDGLLKSGGMAGPTDPSKPDANRPEPPATGSATADVRGSTTRRR